MVSTEARKLFLSLYQRQKLRMVVRPIPATITCLSLSPPTSKLALSLCPPWSSVASLGPSDHFPGIEATVQIYEVT